MAVSRISGKFESMALILDLENTLQIMNLIFVYRNECF